MASITQDMKFRLSLLKHADKHSVTKAAIKYKTNRQYVYRWRRHFDGSIESLRDRSRRPHHHPNQHTPAEIKLIWRGYTRSIPGLYRFLRKQGIMAVHPPNLKYIPKPYEQMQRPGQRIQIDVKFVPSSCLKNPRGISEKFYQYTVIDEYSIWHFVEAFHEYNTYNSSQFLEHMIKAFPLPIECVQTNNGPEFTNRFTSRKKNLPFCRSAFRSAVIARIMRVFMPRIPFILLRIFLHN